MSQPRVGTIVRRQIPLVAPQLRPSANRPLSGSGPSHHSPYSNNMSVGTRGISILPNNGHSRRLINFNTIPPSNAYLSAGSKIRHMQTPNLGHNITPIMISPQPQFDPENPRQPPVEIMATQGDQLNEESTKPAYVK